ncbi:hypothetical protein LEP1GSC192_2318 [Leptospira sp. B5-022]|nr:hypothetical protein LEP1GSC192_2318 [Leptospira sp. B5-022]
MIGNLFLPEKTALENLFQIKPRLEIFFKKIAVIFTNFQPNFF